jgi:hypothetical protein
MTTVGLKVNNIFIYNIFNQFNKGFGYGLSRKISPRDKSRDRQLRNPASE